MNMPILQPIPIPTKGLPWHKRIWKGWTSPRKFRVLASYEYAYDGSTYVIPQGFVFDGASIPRLFWFFISPYGIMLLPGLKHDYAYQTGTILHRDYGYEILTRKEADKLFLETGKETNGVWIADYICYWVLRMFGWIVWNRYRRVGK